MMRTPAAAAVVALAVLATPMAAVADPLPTGSTFSDGVVYLGENYEGEIGTGSLAGVATPTQVDYSGTALQDRTATHFVTNAITHLVLTDDGEILSWGRGGFGQLGDGTTDNLRSAAAVIDVAGTPLEDKTVTSISLGWNTAYALTSDGTVVGWGSNRAGEIGDGTSEERSRPTAVNLAPLGGKEISSVFALYRGALIQTTDGSIFAWGANDNETLVPGAPRAVLEPTPIDVSGSDLEGKTIAELRWGPTGAGGDPISVLIRTTDGDVLSWGEDPTGFLGQGVVGAKALKPTAVPALVGIPIKELRAGAGSSALALTETGDVYSWGDNAFGALGFGDIVNRPTPTLLPLPGPAKTLVAGLWVGFALLNDGTVSAWGDPSSGTLGQGLSDVPQTPQTIPTNGTALEGRDVNAIRSTNGATIMFTTPTVIEPISILTPADGSTVEPEFTITGSGEYGSLVELTLGNQVLDLFEITNPDGSWSVSTATDLTGTLTITVRQLVDDSTASVTVTVAADPVIAPVTITAPVDGSTVDLRPTLAGTGEPGATITLTHGDATLGTAIVGDNGRWTFTPTADLPAGATTVTATQDVDGSEATVSFVISTPTTPVDPGDDGDTGGATDGSLAATGADASLILPVAAGALAVIASGLLLLIKRARRIEI